MAALAGLPGVSTVELNLQQDLVRVTASNSGPTIDAMIIAVGEAGFKATLAATPSGNLHWQPAFPSYPSTNPNPSATPNPSTTSTTLTPSTRPDLAALHADPSKLPQSIRKTIAESAKHSQLTIIFFHAPWCPACQHMQDLLQSNPELKQLLATHTLVTIDTDANPETAKACLVSAIPEIRILNSKGEFKSAFIGKHDPAALLAVLQPND